MINETVRQLKEQMDAFEKRLEELEKKVNNATKPKVEKPTK